MPPVRKYQGKKPAKKASPVKKEEDVFDQLFGPRRSPNPFSSSSESIPTPSPGPSVLQPTCDSLFLRHHNFFVGSPPCEEDEKKYCWQGSDSKFATKSRKIRKFRKRPMDNSKDDIIITKGIRPLRKLLPKLISLKTPGVPIGQSTPIGERTSYSSKFARVIANLFDDEDVSPLLSSKVPFIPNPLSPSNRILRLPVTEDTPKSSGIPPRPSMDSITNRMLRMDLSGASEPSDVNVNVSRLCEPNAKDQEDGKSSLQESLPGVGTLHLQAGPSSASPASPSISNHANVLPPDHSSAFLGFPSLHPLPIPPDKELAESMLSEVDADATKDEKSYLPENSHPNLETSILQAEASSAFLGFSTIASTPTFVPPTRDEMQLYRASPFYVTRRKRRTLARSSKGSSGSSEDVAKKRQHLRAMDRTKRDSGDMASPESCHSGVDSSNESALDEVGNTLPKRLSRFKEGSSSGTSSDDFCSMGSVPSSPERGNRNMSIRALDMSTFRRRSLNETVPSFRNPARDDLMSSSEDENDEEGIGDILSRPSDVALYQPYEPGLLEPLHENVEIVDDEDENSSLSSESSAKKSPVDSLDSNRTPNMRRKANRHSEERSPTGRSSLGRASVIPELVSVIEEDSFSSDTVAPLDEQPLRLPGGKKYRRSLLIIQNIDAPSETDGFKGRRYHENVEEVLRLQISQCESQAETPVQMIRNRISIRRKSWIKQNTPPPRRRLTLPPKTLDRSSVTLETPAALRLPPLRLTNRTLLADRTPLGPCTLQNVDPPIFNREAILKLCDQTEPVSFSDILPPESYEGCFKLGEGVYGEVFAVKRNEISTVLKIIPVEGSRKVNEAEQKTFSEIAPELIIAKKLHDLRFETSNGAYRAGGFAEIVGMKFVQGCYPTQLLDCWDGFDEDKGSYNERPDFFPETQKFIVLEQANAGAALEEYNFNHASTALSLFKQITYSLAVAECALEFEHRDLHMGNVLISRTTKRKFTYVIKSREVSVPANGVKGTIIDYTLSRMNTSNGPLYNDLSKDPELFLGTGDFQFDVYRQMKKDVNNEWSQHQPKTNARWLFYIVDKLLKKEYQRKTAKVHKDGLRVLMNIETWIESCNSAVEVSERLAEL